MHPADRATVIIAICVTLVILGAYGLLAMALISL